MGFIALEVAAPTGQVYAIPAMYLMQLLQLCVCRLGPLESCNSSRLGYEDA